MTLRPDPDAASSPRAVVGQGPLLARGDEQPHAPEADAWWGESWDFDFATANAGLGGYVRLGLLPNQRSCWYWACVVGAGRDPVMVVDHEVEPPRRGGLEIRSEGLWADHIVEEPFDHVSVGCEAFALRLDDPAAAVTGPLLGERTPFGLDLGWETDGPMVQTAVAGRGYALPCRVVGEVLVGDERIELDAFGWRRHRWGVEDWWSAARDLTVGRLADGTWIYDDVAVPVTTAATEVTPSGDGGHGGHGGDDVAAPHATEVTPSGDGGDGGHGVEGLTRARHQTHPVAEAPVLLPAADGRRVYVRRILCRIGDLAGGRTGAGWTERTTVLGKESSG